MCAYGSGESLCEVLGRECVVFAVAEVGEVEVAVILSYKVGEVDDSFLVAGVEQTYKIDSGVLYIFFGIFGRKNPFERVFLSLFLLTLGRTPPRAAVGAPAWGGRSDASVVIVVASAGAESAHCYSCCERISCCLE